MIDFELIDAAIVPLDKAAIRRALGRAEKKLARLHGWPKGRHFVAIESVSPDASRKLNLTVRQCDEPTDVISLPARDVTGGKQTVSTDEKGQLTFRLNQRTAINPLPVLGQLIICPAVIAAQAVQSGQSPTRELEWVIEHGIYHLAGFHHTGD